MKGRLPKLSPQQQDEIRRRLAAGTDTVRALAAEFGVGKATIGRLSGHSGQIRDVAHKVAEAQTALDALPVAHQHQALSLAEKLRSISFSYASAAELGARTAHRFHALANSEAQKVDDANPLSSHSLDAMKGIAVLTKLGNEALIPASNLLAANKPTIERINAEKPAEPQLDPSKLSPATLADLLAARDAGSV